jgi:hypothetical protein
MLAFLAQLLNFGLSLLLWLIIGRYVLHLISGGRKTFFSELFRRGTDPWFRVMRRVTPAPVSDRHIPILAILMILNLRLLVGLLIGPSG